MVRNLLAALLAAIFTLACNAEGGTEPTPTDKVDVVETPETKMATLVIEIKGQTGTASPRRLGPPADTLTVNLYKDDDGTNVPIEWTNGLAMAKVGVGKYTCEVIASGFAPETSPVEVTKENLGTTVDVTISLSANGPTKPEAVNLGEYSVLWAHWTPPDESSIGMFDDGGSVYVTYTPTFENAPAQYRFQGDMPELTCYVTEGRKVNCPTWTDQTGTLAEGTGEFTEDDAEATIKVVFTSNPGDPDEYPTYRVYKITRK